VFDRLFELLFKYRPLVFDQGDFVFASPWSYLLLIAVLGFLSGRPEFLDLALIYVFLNFITTIAILKFVQYRNFGSSGLSDS